MSALGDFAAGVDDQREGIEGGLVAEPLDEREAVAVGEGEIEDQQVGGAGDALADGLLAGGGVLDVDGGVLEAGDDDAGEIFVVLDEQDVGGAFAGVQDATEFGEEKAFVEGLLDPALGVAGELGTEGGGEHAEDDDRDVGGGRGVAQALEGLPAAESGHVEIEEDGFDVVFGGEDESLIAGGGFEDGVALTGEVMVDDGADALVVVADEDGAFSAGGGWERALRWRRRWSEWCGGA